MLTDWLIYTRSDIRYNEPYVNHIGDAYGECWLKRL
jgi:hypothetical protein